MGGPQNLNAAADLASDLAKEAPTNGRMQLLAGQALLMKGNLDEALTHLQRAAQADRWQRPRKWRWRAWSWCGKTMPPYWNTPMRL